MQFHSFGIPSAFPSLMSCLHSFMNPYIRSAQVSRGPTLYQAPWFWDAAVNRGMGLSSQRYALLARKTGDSDKNT